MNLGIINQVVPREELREATQKMVDELLRNSPAIIGLAKIAINRSLEIPLQAGMSYERDLFALAFSYEDQKEGAKAFLEKRKPRYRASRPQRCRRRAGRPAPVGPLEGWGALPHETRLRWCDKTHGRQTEEAAQSADLVTHGICEDCDEFHRVQRAELAAGIRQPVRRARCSAWTITTAGC